MPVPMERFLPRGQADIANETPAAYMPALASLRTCRDEQEVIDALDLTPAHLHLGVALAMTTRSNVYAPFILKAVLRRVGFKAMASAIGTQRAGAIMHRWNFEGDLPAFV